MSSKTHDGDFGGLDGADAWCQDLAESAGHTGTFRAWLSSSAGSPATRFSQAQTIYKLVDGTIVANSWFDLTDGTIDHPINLDEHGFAPDPNPHLTCGVEYTGVWSNTDDDGTRYQPANDCMDWTSPVLGFGAWGGWEQVSFRWTRWCYTTQGNTCSKQARVYCFQQ